MVMVLRFSWKVLTDALGCGGERQLLQQQSQSCGWCPHTHHQCFSLRRALLKRNCTPEEKSKVFTRGFAKKIKRCLIQQNDYQNFIRGKMSLLPLLQFSSGEEWLCKVVAKVTVQGVFFGFFGGSVPIAIVFQWKAHLYISWCGLRNHANSVGAV